MIIDAYNLFAEDLSIAGSAATAIAGNVIDLKNARDIGQGQPLYLIIQVTVEFDPATSANVTLAFVSAATATITSSPTTHWTTGALAAPTYFPAGKRFVVALPPEGAEYLQYIGLLVTRSATVDAGSITAFLSMDPAGWKAYPEAAS